MTRLVVRLAPTLALGVALVLAWSWIAHSLAVAFAKAVP